MNYFLASILSLFMLSSMSGVNESLSHNSVWVMLQDSRGVMWFGTKEGLNCYNGYDNTVYKYDPSDSHSLGNSFIRALYEVTPGEELWVGTDEGLYICDIPNGEFTRFNVSTPDGTIINGTVNAITKIHDDLWISEIDKGFYRYNLSNGDLKFYPTGKFHWSIATDNYGSIWVASFEGGVYRYNRQTNSFLFSAINNEGVVNSDYDTRSFFYDAINDCMWIGTFIKGIVRYDFKTHKWSEYQINDGSDLLYEINSITMYSSNELALGTEKGLYSFNTISHKFEKQANIQSIFSLIHDREGGIWAGTYYDGVQYLSPGYKAIIQHTIPDTQGRVVSAFVTDQNDKNKIWISARDVLGGLTRYDKLTGDYVEFDNLMPYHNIRSLSYFDNALWVGTYSNGMIKIGDNGRTQHFSRTEGNFTTLSHNSVYSIFQASDKTIYVGTIMGLDIYDPVNNVFTNVPEIRNTRVHSIIEDHLGLIWVATYQQGLYCYNPATDTWVSYRHNHEKGSLPSDRLICLYGDKQQRLFIGTEGAGMCRFNYQTQTFEPISDQISISTGIICSIVGDEQGNLWISKSNSINKIDIENGKIQVLEESIGMKGNYYTYNSSYIDGDGLLYFGYTGGYVTINTSLLTTLKVPPRLMLTGVRNYENLTEYDYTKPITIGPYNPSINFNFVALSYKFPAHNSYTYYLEGHEEEWLHTTTNRSASYINLPPGKYRFHLKAANSDGVWADESEWISLPLTVKKVIWQRNFMIILYIAFLLLLIYFTIYLSRKKEGKKLEDKMTHYQIEKDKELYKRQIQFFTNIIHEIRTPLSLIKAPLESIIQTSTANEETSENLQVMDRNVERLHTLADQLLDFRKIEQNTIVFNFKPHDLREIVQRVSYRFKAACRLKSIDYEESLPEEPLICSVDSEAINKILSNLLSNALKYAVSKIKVQLTRTDKNISLEVINDGSHIPEKYWESIFQPFFQVNEDKDIFRKEGSGIGLALVKSLVENHTGKIKVYSEPNYTIFTVTIPYVKSSPNLSSLTDDLLDEDIILSEEFDYQDQDDKKEFVNTLLIVEDNLEMLNFLKNNFARLYNVLTAKNGNEALARLEENTIIDVIITDILMPEMDGVELCKAIRSMTMFCHIPIILLTAQTDIRSKTEGLDYGADVFIEKPFSLEFLKAQVASIIKNRNQLKEVFTTSPFIPPQSIAHNTYDIEFLTNINKIIMNNLSESGNIIETLANEMAISRSSLHKKIKSISGMTPNDYIQLIRLKRAAELLSGNEYQISEIAYLVGFNSPSYFSKCFYNQFGMLPRDFVMKTKVES
ncbi:MAG: response regulator [Fermentimonas sp.]|nr:response regulator [Fermentimonas sp.]